MGLFAFGKKKTDTPKVAAVIVAAGKSERMGMDKILADLCDIPVIARTLLAFEKSEYISEIVVVTKAESLNAVAEICSKYAITKATQVLIGGSTRMESALIGVSNLKTKCDYIAIHDGARPLIKQELITECVKGAQSYRAALPVLKSTDTLKIIDERGLIVGTVDREKMVRVQTPQIFETDIIKGALTKAVTSGKTYTDDSSAVEAMGFKVLGVPGDEENIKLTTPNDFLIAKEILEKRGDYVANRSWL